MSRRGKCIQNHGEVTGKCLNMDRGSDDLKSAATVARMGTSRKCRRNMTNSSTPRLFPARRLPDIDISADRTGERARTVQFRALPVPYSSASLPPCYGDQLA